ncbi:MAG: molybdenum cofactor cytidylyltransferase [Desulfobacula sp.]|nr:molybdenum cofactor cytidylyltransferase [Desulfobacula sp.]
MAPGITVSDMGAPDMTAPTKRIAGVLLAAGTASRLGKTKQLLPFRGSTLLGRVMENAAASDLDELVVVLGHDADRIMQSLDFSGMKTVINPDYSKGQGTSLAKGLEAVSPSCDGVLFLLADQPLVTPDMINRLIRAFQDSGAPLVIPFYRGSRGNPVLVARSLFPRLLSLSADTGARALFDEYKASILRVEVDTDAVLVDVDTARDYEALLSRPFPEP